MATNALGYYTSIQDTFRLLLSGHSFPECVREEMLMVDADLGEIYIACSTNMTSTAAY